jgi:hypothetical protein
MNTSLAISCIGDAKSREIRGGHRLCACWRSGDWLSTCSPGGVGDGRERAQGRALFGDDDLRHRWPPKE